MTLPSIDLVIFDCDGVLIDSEMISAEVLVDMLADDGVDIDTGHVFETFTGTSFPTVVAQLVERYPQVDGDRLEARYRDALFAAYTERLAPMLGVHEVLARLKPAKCVATSSSPERVGLSLALTGLDRVFGENFFTASQVANGKPAPDLMLLAARSMHADPAHCLVIEDTLVGLEAARAAGMACWYFTGGTHLGGVGQTLPAALTKVQIFDKWADFYHLAPDLCE